VNIRFEPELGHNNLTTLFIALCVAYPLPTLRKNRRTQHRLAVKGRNRDDGADRARVGQAVGNVLI
jgi:hypothetical protein